MTGSGLPLEGVRVVEMTHMVMGPTCGMILALALDRELRAQGSDLHAFDRRFFGSVKAGAPWTADHWFATASGLGAGEAFVAQARALVGADGTAALAALAQLAPQNSTSER